LGLGPRHLLGVYSPVGPREQTNIKGEFRAQGKKGVAFERASELGELSDFAGSNERSNRKKGEGGGESGQGEKKHTSY